MRERGLVRRLELGNDAARELLAELDAPLIEGVDVPDGGLREDAVLVERDQLAERLRGEALREQRRARAVALEAAVRRRARSGRSLGAHLRLGLAEGERLALREHVREQQIVLVVAARARAAARRR